jgi:hypothetical protein
MDLTTVHPGDIIEAEVNSRKFLAFVEAKHYRSLTVTPVQREITYRTVKSTEVQRLWLLSKQRPRQRNTKEAVHG